MAEEILEPQPSEMLGQVAAHQGAELPGGAAPVEAPAAEPVAAAPVEPAAEAAPQVETPFEVDGQKFATEADAFEFLKGQYGKVQTDQMLSEARLQGMQDAMHMTPSAQAPLPVEEAAPAIDMDKFYEDPAKYMAERDAAIEERLMGKVSQRQAAADQDQAVWNNFTTSHPDLADFKADVEAVAMQHQETVQMLSKRDPKKAYDYVALKVREKFQRYADVMKPTRVLSNTKVETPMGSNQVVTTQNNSPNPTEGLDMISQMRNMRK